MIIYICLRFFSLKLPKMSTKNEVILMSTSRISRISYHSDNNYDHTRFHNNVNRLLSIKSYLNERQQQQQNHDGRLSTTTATLLPRINNKNNSLLSIHNNSTTKYRRPPPPTPSQKATTTPSSYQQRHCAPIKLPPIRAKKKTATNASI